ncbi:MAG: chorismate mutase [Anaerolineales bacterium]
MAVRGIRGAIVASADQPDAILSATRKLIDEIMRANPALTTEEIASAFFTTTQDLTSAYPAQAVRESGWREVPLLCGQEIPVPEGLQHCIRVLIHWNTDLTQAEIRHVYLGRARKLRPDLTDLEGGEKQP